MDPRARGASGADQLARACGRGLPRAHPLSRTAVRPGRRVAGDRPHRRLRGRDRGWTDLEGRAAAPDTLPPGDAASWRRADPPPRLSGDTGDRARARARAPGRCRRLRLEHVPLAVGDRVVPRAPGAVCARRRESRRRPARRVAEDRQGDGRAPDRPRCGRSPRHRLARAQLDARPRRGSAPSRDLRQHRRRRGVRGPRGRPRAAALSAT